MMKFIAGFAIVFVILSQQGLAEPIALDKSSDDDMTTSETFGYGYYPQPGLYGPGLVTAGSYHTTPFATVGTYPSLPLATTTSLSSTSSGYARSGYGSGYKYGGSYGYGRRFGYGSSGAANEFYRSHPVYSNWS